MRLDDNEFEALYPFGESLSVALLDARIDPATGDALWEQEDYDQPPLTRKRQAALDRYFRDIRLERVQPTVGWHRIEGLPNVVFWTFVTIVLGLLPLIGGREAGLNPGLFVLGISGGLFVFGFLGVFFGPVVLGTLKVFVELFAREVSEPSRERQIDG